MALGTRHAPLASALDDEDILVAYRCICAMLERKATPSEAEHTYRDRRLPVLELAQCRMARLCAQSVADALDKLGVRGPSKDNGTAHSGRPEKVDIFVL